MQSEIRKDYVQEKYVIIAPHRKARPHAIARQAVRSQEKTFCYFCPEALHGVKKLARRGSGTAWQVVSIANIFPAVSQNNPKAYGCQEVVVETPDHTKELDDLSVTHISRIFEVYAERTRSISRDKKIEYILIFKNNGGRAGASLQHAHSQIFATEFLPPHLKDKSQKVQEYKLTTGGCIYCDVIAKEQLGPRLVWEDKHVIAFTPYASMHNYEIWIMPKRHLDNITVLTSGEKRSMARTLKYVLRRITDLNLPYNFYFHQVINDEDQHLYMKVTPRGSVWAGVEIGSGLIINPITPEDAAKFYRKGNLLK